MPVTASSRYVRLKSPSNRMCSVGEMVASLDVTTRLSSPNTLPVMFQTDVSGCERQAL